MSDTVPEVEPDRLPPIVYVPCVEHVSDIEDVEFAYRRTNDGRMALLAYTALDRLHDRAGEDQPWVLMPAQAMQVLYAEQPWDLLLLDLDIPEEHRWGASR